MGVMWTEEQQKVIDVRGRNVLVSAAAGSGKTAVLVERILSMITEGRHPLDIDRLLIVTFTRAAASEMRERIRRAIETRLEQDPENEHLQRQSTLIHNAQINTIDGFCAYVLRNYFHMIDLDPGYRIVEEGELRLLKRDVLRDVMESAYAAGTEEFHDLVECYAPGRDDRAVEELVLRLFEYSMSYPWPEEWLEQCRGDYRVDSVGELEQTLWIQMLPREADSMLHDAEVLTCESLRLCALPAGPSQYQKAIEDDLELIRMLRETEGFDERVRLLSNLKFTALSRKKNPDAAEWAIARVKDTRDEVKDILRKLKDSCYFITEDEILGQVRQCRGPVEALVGLTLDFSAAFAEKKREKNLVDFADIEHFALQILLERGEDGSLLRSPAARELSERFAEIFIDEYQDSNLVQESILNAISRMDEGQNNVFMVGDVKQSIYRFRLARPELFMEKFHSYPTSERGTGTLRIDLHKNFRSRAEVLGGVNFIFRQIMGEDLGGVEYDDDAALYPAAAFPEGNDPDFAATEVLLVEKNDPILGEESDKNVRELEALAIANRIEAMVGRERVLDSATGTYRPVRYGDIVILLRTMSGWGETFSRVLTGQGIPSYCTTRTGYFSAVEVVTVLSYLHILDNPRQDIPFGAVLRSPIVGCSAEEMARIRLAGEKEDYCVCARRFLEKGDDSALQGKLKRFFVQYESLRSRVPYTPIHELIQDILRETGYEYYAEAMPAGEQRAANLRMLVEKAMEFEQTSYRGLFNFIRYIENLQKYDVDFGEVNISAGDDLVRIMTIHKSKGLEFPVVFVAGMSKRFNQQDTNAALVIHPDLGIGADCIDPKERVRFPSLMKSMIRSSLHAENLGEELRVLYVAMTRAKEKLILSGCVKDLRSVSWDSWVQMGRREQLLYYRRRLGAGCYFDWVLSALGKHPVFRSLYDRDELWYEERDFCGGEIPVKLIALTPAKLVERQVERQAGAQMSRELLKDWDGETVYDGELREMFARRFSYAYPYENQADIPVKVTVSELKRQGQRDEDSYELYFEPDVIPLIPEFAREGEEKAEGAERGTAYHRLMECLDLSRAKTAEEIRAQMDGLLAAGKMDERMAECIDAEEIRTFAGSSLGQRMARAQADGTLRREQPFVISQNASDMKQRWGNDASILVQGIIDVYFQEEDGLILADYKTDRVRRPEELAEKYRVQLDYYARALERLMGLPVREKIIYSFALGCEVRVE